MRALVNARGAFPLMWVNLSEEAYKSLYGDEATRLLGLCGGWRSDADCYGISFLPKEAIVSQVYDAPHAEPRKIGVIIGRRVRHDPNGFGIELVCRLHGQIEQPRWLEIHE